MGKVTLSHLGIVCALGSTQDSIRRNLLQGKTLSDSMSFRASKESAMVGLVDRAALPNLPEELHRLNSIAHRMIYAAWLQIRESILDACSRFGAHRIGIVIGSSTSGLDATESAIYGETKGQHYFFRQHEMGSIVDLVRGLAPIQGPGYTISTACTSGAKALISARELIEQNLCDAVVCGGADALCDLTLNGFHSLASVSQTLTNPFSKNRNGLNLGEGAALFLMVRGSQGITLAGAGESGDAHHLSAPHPEGTGAIAAISAALEDAGLSPQQLAYINLHGTGTPLNDAMEARAISQVCNQVPCSTTKPLTGHTLGAAGAIEAGLCWLCLDASSQEIELPPHLYDGEYDSTIPRIALVTKGTKVSVGSQCNILSTSFAFGGNNCALIFSKEATPV